MKNNLLKKLILPVFLLLGSFIYAQTVTGVVSDASGPVPGANVILKGTTTGTVTDFDGNYSIAVNNGDILVFSFVGYLSQEISYTGQATIDVLLQEDAALLDEVIIVGYGSAVKKEITTAVTSVNAEEFNQGVISDPVQLLQGKVAGLSVYNKGGDPNSNGVIRLRGISTVGGNTETLVVIDGILGNNMNNVDPSDIENITVLKDGSAAAIYGTRGSSGVIIITTKGGKKGQALQINYNGQFATSSIANQIDNMSASEFLAAGGTDLGSTTDWLDEVTRTAYSKIHNVSAVGGGDNSSYRVSVNFRDTEGILENSGFDQFNARTKFSGNLLNDKLRITVNSSLTQRDSEFGFTEALRYGVLYNPTAPILGVDAPFVFNAPQFGGFFETLGLFDSFNPVSIATQSKNFGEQTTLNYSLDFRYTISDELTANLNFSDQVVRTTERQWYPTTAFFRGNALSPFNKGRAAFFNSESRNKTLELYGTYNTIFSDTFTFKFTGGYSFQESDYNEHFFELGDFPPGVDFDFSNQIEAAQDLLEAGRIDANSGRNDNDRIIAFFARANATYDNAIYFNASLRREGSSRFGEDEQWGLFPAAAIGADLNNYLNIDNVNLLKVRLGYGVTGAIPPGVGLSQTTFNINNGANGFGPAATGLGTRKANPGLKWEEKREVNLGFEFNMGPWDATIDLYNRDIVDFITEVNIDAAANDGFTRQFQNGGELNTKGLEISVNYEVVNNDKISYNTGIIFSTYKTVLEKNVGGDRTIANLGSPGQNDTQMILVREGEEIGQIWGPVFTGEVNADGTQVLADLNGDGVLVTDQGNALSEDADFKVLGKGLPSFEIGWTNQISFGNWDVNAFFRGAFGHSLVNTFRAFYEPLIGSQSSYNFIATELANPDITAAQFSSLYVEKAGFFKLDNLSVGYNFDINNSYFRNIRLSLSGQNIFTITNYTGSDPEPSLQDFGAASNADFVNDTPDVLAPGIDRRNNYFTSTTITLGININF